MFKIEILAFDISALTSEWLFSALGKVPTCVSSYCLRFLTLRAQQQKMIGRLLIREYCLRRGIDWTWEWKITSAGKPFIPNGPHFSITHTGNWVVVAVDETHEVGIDFEQILQVEVSDLATRFHPDEYSYLQNKSFDLLTFYQIWTKKEAFCKAIGKGIANGIADFSVIGDHLLEEEHWLFKSLPILEGYEGTCCYQGLEKELLVEVITYDQLYQNKGFE